MRTEAVILEPYDNIDSLLDRLNQHAALSGGMTRFLIVWPPRGLILKKSFDAAQVKNWGLKNGFQIAFCSKNQQIQALGEQHDIPVFADRDEATRHRWVNSTRITPDTGGEQLTHLALLRTEFDTHHTPLHSFGRIVIAFLCALSVLIMAGLFLPQAEILIEIQPHSVEQEIPFWTNQDLKSVTLNGGVPSLKETIVFTMSASVPVSGTAQGIGTLSSGYVMLYSECTRPQRIERGTFLYAGTDAEMPTFQTSSEIEIAPGEAQNVAVEALQAGTAHNAQSGRINRIESPYERCIQVSQPDALSGGNDGLFSSVTEADYESAQQKIIQDLNALVEKALSERYGEARIILVQSLKIEQIISEERNPEVGYIGQEFTLKQRLNVAVRSVRLSDLQAAAHSILTLSYPDGFVPNTAYPHFLDWKFSQDKDKLTWQAHASISGEIIPDTTTLRQALCGETIDQAADVLSTYQTNVQINLWPHFLRRMPLIAQRIKISLTGTQ